MLPHAMEAALRSCHMLWRPQTRVQSRAYRATELQRGKGRRRPHVSQLHSCAVRWGLSLLLQCPSSFGAARRDCSQQHHCLPQRPRHVQQRQRKTAVGRRAGGKAVDFGPWMRSEPLLPFCLLWFSARWRSVGRCNVARWRGRSLRPISAPLRAAAWWCCGKGRRGVRARWRGSFSSVSVRCLPCVCPASFVHGGCGARRPHGQDTVYSRAATSPAPLPRAAPRTGTKREGLHQWPWCVRSHLFFFGVASVRGNGRAGLRFGGAEAKIRFLVPWTSGAQRAVRAHGGGQRGGMF